MDYVILIVQCVMYSFVYISCLCSMYFIIIYHKNIHAFSPLKLLLLINKSFSMNITMLHTLFVSYQLDY